MNSEDDRIRKNIEILKQFGDKPADVDELMKAMEKESEKLECISQCGCSCHSSPGVLHCVPCCKYSGILK
jgi:hypothetical protein